MKKFVLVAAVLLLTTGFVFATPGSSDTPSTTPIQLKTGDVVVTAALQGYLTLSGLTPTTTFLLNTAGATVSVADATVATNLRNWNMTITALSSTSTDSALVSTDGNAYRIPYQLSLASADPTIGNWTAAYIKTGGISQDFHNRVSGGADGKLITLSITYGGEQTATWFAGLTYTDTITVTVKAL
jgi:hypothetical protein